MNWALAITLLVLSPVTAKAAVSPSDLLPLRTCAHSVSKSIDGRSISEGWSSDDENSFYFLNCDDGPTLGQNHYVFTPNGVYYFFIKPHKDYKGGMEGTQFRLSLENKIYYYKNNIVGGMGDLFDQAGVNLSVRQSTEEDAKMDVSPKNPVINYYMKALTGKGDASAAIEAVVLPADRVEKAQACIRKAILSHGKSLHRVYTHRFEYRQVSSDVLKTYRQFVQGALASPACDADTEIRSQFNTFIADLP